MAWFAAHQIGDAWQWFLIQDPLSKETGLISNRWKVHGHSTRFAKAKPYQNGGGDVLVVEWATPWRLVLLSDVSTALLWRVITRLTPWVASCHLEDESRLNVWRWRSSMLRSTARLYTIKITEQGHRIQDSAGADFGSCAIFQRSMAALFGKKVMQYHRKRMH